MNPVSRQSIPANPQAKRAPRQQRGFGVAQRPANPAAQQGLLDRWLGGKQASNPTSTPSAQSVATLPKRIVTPKAGAIPQRAVAASRTASPQRGRPAVAARKPEPLPRPIARGPIAQGPVTRVSQRKAPLPKPAPGLIRSLDKLDTVAKASAKPDVKPSIDSVVFATGNADEGVVFATDMAADKKSKQLITSIASEPANNKKTTSSDPIFVSDATPVEPTPIFASDTPSAVAAKPKAPAPLPQVIAGPLTAEHLAEVAEDCDACTAAEAPQPIVAAPRPPVPTSTPEPVKITPVENSLANTKPSKRAIEILSDTRDAAARAGDQAEFSRVVQQCRHVLAIDQSEVVVGYANELAAWALNKRGELRADAGELVDAMADFNESLRMDDGRWRARHNRGVLHAQAGRYGEAFTDFNDVIQQRPEFAKAYSNRASLYVQAGDFDLALDDYRRAISLNPDLAVAHKGRGRVCHMLGRMDEALQHFDAAVLLAPNDAHIASCRADLLTDNARYGEAVAGYQRAIRLDPLLATAYRNLAWLRATCPDARFRDGVAAVEQAGKALRLTSEEDDVSLDTLAAAHAAAGDFDQAVKYIRRAMTAASGADAEAYGQRLQLYQSGQLFLSSPVASVQQAGYQQ